MNRQIVFIINIVFLIVVSFQHSPHLLSQTIPTSFYHDTSTILPYANLQVSFDNGATRRIPFTPVIINKSPSGIHNFANDIDVEEKVLFAGNGIVSSGSDYNAYKNHNLQGEILHES